MSRWRFAFLYLLAWLPFAALYAAVLALQPNLRPADAILASVTTIGSAALLGGGVWWLSRRIPFVSTHRWRFVVAHVLLAALYGALLTTQIALSIRFGASEVAFNRYVRDAMAWQTLFGMSLYGIIAGISYAAHAASRLREEERRSARAEALRIDAELRALRTQLNPHFLFNTLHSITALVRFDPGQGERALEQFATLLRYVLDVNRERSEEVSLEQELQFVRTYLALEQLRLDDRLRVEEDIEPDALECRVLSFSLQPLVENAIRHGIAPRSAPGRVCIGAQLADDQLVLTVSDDGAGANATTLANVTGIGLRAARQRIEARWGAEGRFEIITEPGRGFLVRITTPAVTASLSKSNGTSLRSKPAHRAILPAASLGTS